MRRLHDVISFLLSMQVSKATRSHECDAATAAAGGSKRAKRKCGFGGHGGHGALTFGEAVATETATELISLTLARTCQVCRRRHKTPPGCNNLPHFRLRLKKRPPFEETDVSDVAPSLYVNTAHSLDKGSKVSALLVWLRRSQTADKNKGIWKRKIERYEPLERREGHTHTHTI